MLLYCIALYVLPLVQLNQISKIATMNTGISLALYTSLILQKNLQSRNYSVIIVLSSKLQTQRLFENDVFQDPSPTNVNEVHQPAHT